MKILNKTSTWTAKLTRWYQKNHRKLPWRRTCDPYKIWVSEIMLQQTTVGAVIPYYERWVRRFPSIRHVARASLEDVLTSWQGLGYYSRARNLHQAAGIIVREYDGSIPDNREVLKKLPGFGPYTTGAVLSIAFGQRQPIVDANVRRVICRLRMLKGKSTLLDKHIYSFLQDAMPALHPGIFNQALMELGALVCKPEDPACPACPVKSDCRAYAQGVQEAFPPRVRKAVKRIETVVGIIRSKDSIFMQKRPPTGLLAGFWELPGGKVERGETPRQALARELKEELGVRVLTARHTATIRHAYTQFQVRLFAWECEVAPAPKENATHRWVSRRELAKYPMPAGTVKVLAAVQARLGKIS
ncbi:MAG: A/G-specific adenine glycosylase [Candidatus Omnitrophica bacterium]|nr:A/G-specific adenine glycosylase [Candidatus Omnitrophota bacterium]